MAPAARAFPEVGVAQREHAHGTPGPKTPTQWGLVRPESAQCEAGAAGAAASGTPTHTHHPLQAPRSYTPRHNREAAPRPCAPRQRGRRHPRHATAAGHEWASMSPGVRQTGPATAQGTCPCRVSLLGHCISREAGQDSKED